MKSFSIFGREVDKCKIALFRKIDQILLNMKIFCKKRQLLID